MCKPTINTKRALGELYTIYNKLNEKAFEGALSKCQITIQATPISYGHYSVYKIWRDRNGEMYHELNINAITLMRPIEEVVATMLHEMCHHYAMENHIQDTSRGGLYHNKRFKEIAEKSGLLEIEHHEKYGWTITKPKDNLLKWVLDEGIEEFGIESVGKVSKGPRPEDFTPIGTTNIPPAKRPSSTRKYICPHCGQSVRATKTVNIICGDCNEKMIEA